MYSSNFNTGEFETGQSLWDQDPLLWNFPTYIPLTMWLLWAVMSDLPDSSPSDPAELNQVGSWSKGHYPGKRERFNQEALWMQWFCGSHRASGSQGYGSLVSTNQRPMFTEVMEEEGLWVRRESRVPLSCLYRQEIGPMAQRKSWLEGTVKATGSNCSWFSHPRKAQVYLQILFPWDSSEFFWWIHTSLGLVYKSGFTDSGVHEW